MNSGDGKVKALMTQLSQKSVRMQFPVSTEQKNEEEWIGEAHETMSQKTIAIFHNRSIHINNYQRRIESKREKNRKKRDSHWILIL